MEIEKELLENRAVMRMNAAKIDAIVSILSREGILDEEELKQEIENRIKKK